MTPPKVSDIGTPAEASEAPPAVSVCLEVLKKRADFVRASNARRQGTPGIHLQGRKRADGEAAGMRVGYTCSKKVGNAVARNRAKRRLREVARAILPHMGRPGWDYVLVAKPGVTTLRAFDLLLSDLHGALARIHKS